MSRTVKTILIVIAALVSLTGIGFLFYNYSKKKSSNTVSVTTPNGKAEFNLDDLINQQSQLVIPQSNDLTFGFTEASKINVDDFFIVRARNTSKANALNKVYLLDFYNVKTGKWGYDKSVALSEVEANKQFAKITSSTAFKDIPQTEVEIFVIPKSLIILNANSPNNYNPNDFNFAEVNEPNIFGNMEGIVLMFTGGFSAATGIMFNAPTAVAGGVVALSSMIFSGCKALWLRQAYTHKEFKRIVVFKKP